MQYLCTEADKQTSDIDIVRMTLFTLTPVDMFGDRVFGLVRWRDMSATSKTERHVLSPCKFSHSPPRLYIVVTEHLCSFLFLCQSVTTDRNANAK